VPPPNHEKTEPQPQYVGQPARTCLGVNASFTFTAHAVYLPRPRIEIPGPQGIQAIFNWQAAKAVSPARMCTAVLVNTVVSY
jgi:hypothetical protein